MINATLRSLCALILLLGFLAHGTAKAQPFIRLSLQEFVKDPHRLQSLFTGIQVMKSRNNAPRESVEYRTSWEYWASIHGYLGPDSKNGTVERNKQDRIDRIKAHQDNPEAADLEVAEAVSNYFAGMKDLSVPDELAGKIWNTCEHSAPAHTTRYFFAWHRMFLYFFERVLREASGDPNFALPYWDYTNDAIDQKHPSESPWRLPEVFAFRMINPEGVTACKDDSPCESNPLYESRRTAGFGEFVQLDAIDTDVDNALADADFDNFQLLLEGGVHGLIHCAVGNACLGPYMGIVPTAANDPLFWLHHANIDRLWECWSKMHGGEKNPNPTTDEEWMAREFFFVDEKGNPVSMKVKELFDPNGRIDYRYDKTIDCSRKKQPLVIAERTEEPHMRFDRPEEGEKRIGADQSPVGPSGKSKAEIARLSDVKITQTDQVVALPAGEKVMSAIRAENPSAKPAEKPSANNNKGAFPKPVTSLTKARLILEGVQVSREPGASVRVYIGDKGGTKRVYVGVLSFFEAFAHSDEGEIPGRFTFDISSQLRELSAGSTKDLAVSFVASRGLVGETAGVDPQQFKNVGLNIRQITLETEGTSLPSGP